MRGKSSANLETPHIRLMLCWFPAEKPGCLLSEKGEGSWQKLKKVVLECTSPDGRSYFHRLGGVWGAVFLSAEVRVLVWPACVQSTEVFERGLFESDNNPSVRIQMRISDQKNGELVRLLWLGTHFGTLVKCRKQIHSSSTG